MTLPLPLVRGCHAAHTHTHIHMPLVPCRCPWFVGAMPPPSAVRRPLARHAQHVLLSSAFSSSLRLCLPLTFASHFLSPLPASPPLSSLLSLLSSLLSPLPSPLSPRSPPSLSQPPHAHANARARAIAAEAETEEAAAGGSGEVGTEGASGTGGDSTQAALEDLMEVLGDDDDGAEGSWDEGAPDDDEEAC